MCKHLTGNRKEDDSRHLFTIGEGTVYYRASLKIPKVHKPENLIQYYITEQV